jgi:hypothetical protein
LPSLREHRTSPELLADLVTELVGEAGRRALDGDLEELFEIHRGNVRNCLRQLYDQWARRPSPQPRLEPPARTKWDAIRQGERIAQEERRRLGVAQTPLPEL